MPARSFSINSTSQVLNGSPSFLGILLSSATTSPVNNATTAVPFSATPLTAVGNASTGPANMSGTLAGKTLLVQATAQGLLLPGDTSTVTIVSQSTTPSPSATPGIVIGANERLVLIMRPQQGWLQFLSASGSASLLVYELL